MSIKAKVKTLLACSAVSSSDLAEALEVTPATARNRISIGIKSIDDLVRICNYCNAELSIKAKDGTVITLNIDDLK